MLTNVYYPHKFALEVNDVCVSLTNRNSKIELLHYE